MKLLTHDNPEMRGKPLIVFASDEHHGVEILEIRQHPSPRMKGCKSSTIARVLVRPWNTVFWVWLDMVAPHHVQASRVRFSNQSVTAVSP